MPTDKDLEDVTNAIALAWAGAGPIPESPDLLRWAKNLSDAYLSMKSERDKYKAIVEADTKALKLTVKMHDDLFRQCLSNAIRNAWGQEVNCTLINEAYCKANEALALRGNNGE